MGGKAHKPGRNAWHLGFVELVSERAPADAIVHSEVELSRRPSRVDLVVIRRRERRWPYAAGQVLKGLWPLLSRVTLVDFKSPTHELRARELARLIGYGWQYLEKHFDDLNGHDDLSLVLVTPCRNTAFDKALGKSGLTWASSGHGYGRIEGVAFATHTVFTDEVSEAEADEYLRIFSHHAVRDPDAVDWLQQWIYTTEYSMPAVKQSRSFQEIRKKILSSMTLEERLADLTPAERLTGLAPEERLAALGPEEHIAALTLEERLAGLGPEERLAGLGPEERLAGLGPEERERLASLLSRLDGR